MGFQPGRDEIQGNAKKGRRTLKTRRPDGIVFFRF
jgi:hypothetical protein